MNIDREWPAGQIDPTSYVNNMLKPAYQKIKASNPNVMVITGAPAPTGYFGGCGGGGCDDAPYVAGMMAAGAGSASDCVGVHYNEGIMPPSATSGDPRGAGGHYTRYFQGMINAYTAAGAGQLCFTELGYLSGEEWGSLPSGFLWKAPYNLTVCRARPVSGRCGSRWCPERPGAHDHCLQCRLHDVRRRPAGRLRYDSSRWRLPGV